MSESNTELDAALQAVRRVRQTMSALRWWLHKTDTGKELDNQIFRCLLPVPDDENDT